MPGDNKGVRVNVKADVATLVRANVIGHIARELIAAAGSDSQHLDYVLKGFQKQILQEVEVIFEDTASSDIGYISVKVDWNQYKINLTDSSKRVSFDIDPTRPVTTQVSSLLESVAAYVRQIRAELPASNMRYVFTPRHGHEDEVNRELHTHTLNAEGMAKLRAARAKAQDMISGIRDRGAIQGTYISDSAFSELGITIVNFNTEPFSS